MIASDVPNDSSSNKAPKFHPTIAYSKWVRDFKAYVIRHRECDFVLKNQIKPPKPAEPADSASKSTKAQYDKELKRWETQADLWESGNACLFSHIYFAVDINPRAETLVVQHGAGSNGIAALEGLKTEYENKDSVKGILSDTLAQFQHRKIKNNETISQFIAVIENYRLKLKNLDHEIEDKELISKIITGMTSTINQEYKEVKRSLILHPIENLADLTSRLRRIDEVSISEEEAPTRVLQVDESAALSVPNRFKSFTPSQRQIRPSGKLMTSNPRPSPSTPTPSSSVSPGSNPITCDRCGGRNHLSKDCTTKWQAIERKRSGSHLKRRNNPPKKVQRSFPEDVGQIQRANMAMAKLAEQNPGFALLDSGATSHMFPIDFCDKDSHLVSIPIQLASKNASMMAQRKGDLGLLKEVLFIDDIAHPLVSVMKLTDNGFNINFKSDGADVYLNGILVTKAVREKNLYLIKLSSLIPVNPRETASVASHSPPPSLQALHERLAHSSPKLIKTAIESSLIRGLANPKPCSSPQLICDCCQRGKAHRRPHRNEIREMIPIKLRHPTSFGEVICVDSTGPFSTPSHQEGFRHLLIFKDVASRFIWDFYAVEITAAFSIQCLEIVKSHIQNQGALLRHYHSDGARNLISQAHRQYFIENSITWSFNSPYTPEDNSHAERSFQTIKNRSLAQLLQSNLPPDFWNFSMKYTIHVTNRLPQQTAKGFMSPFQFIHDEPPSLSHTRVWGSQVVVHQPKQKRKNDWSEKGKKGIFMGVHENCVAYEIYMPGEDTFIMSSHVFFGEPPSPCSTPSLPAFLVQTLPKSVEDYQYLVGLSHIDDEDNLTYVTTRVTTLKGYVVAYRAIQSKQSILKEINQSIHIKDIEKLTYKYYLNLSKPSHEDRPQQTTPPREHSRKKPRGSEGKISNDADYHSHLQDLLLSNPIVQKMSEDLSLDPITPKTKKILPTRKCKHILSKLSIIQTGSLKGKSPPHVKQSSSTLILHDPPEAVFASVSSTEDLNFFSLIRGEDGEKWRSARDSEIQSLEKKGCWDIVNLPPNTPTVGSKYVCKVKMNPDGSIAKFKVRLVAQGFTQVEGINFYDTYSPVAKLSTIRTIIALAAINNMSLHHIDVNTAYINAPLDEDIYMRPPKDFNLGRNQVLKLSKSIYGLKQAGLNWYLCISSYLSTLGFTKCLSDCCAFILDKGYETCVIVIVYVDDMIIASRVQTEIQRIKLLIRNKFEIDDLGELKYYLGINIERHADHITVNQRSYITKLIEKYQLEDSRLVHSPLPTNFIFDPHENFNLSPNERSYVENFPTRELIGALNYVAVCTRPDISFAVGALARFQDFPNISTCNAIKHLLKYLNTTKDLHLIFSGSINSVVGFCDSDWASDQLTRKSTSGFVFYLGNSPISWQSKLQSTVALSSTEAEYVSASTATQEALWIRSLLREWGLSMKMPTTLWCDNKGAIQLAKSPINHKRTKHVDIRHHHIRDHVEKGDIVVDHLTTENMPADLLTKNRSNLETLRGILFGGSPIDPSSKRLRIYNKWQNK
jgi:transposase InsO family protein